MLYKYTYLLDTCTVQPLVDIEEIPRYEIKNKIEQQFAVFPESLAIPMYKLFP